MTSPMLPLWYLEWAEKHKRTFNLNIDATASLLEHGESWVAAYTAAELHAATRALQTWPTKLDSWDHRHAIQQTVMDARRAAKPGTTDGAREAFAARHGVCSLCDNTGLVIVPDRVCLHPGGKLLPAKAVGGRQVFATTAVCCDCVMGERVRTSAETLGAPRVTLRTYEANGRPRAVWRAAMAWIDFRGRDPRAAGERLPAGLLDGIGRGAT